MEIDYNDFSPNFIRKHIQNMFKTREKGLFLKRRKIIYIYCTVYNVKQCSKTLRSPCFNKIVLGFFYQLFKKTLFSLHKVHELAMQIGQSLMNN